MTPIFRYFITNEVAAVVLLLTLTTELLVLQSVNLNPIIVPKNVVDR